MPEYSVKLKDIINNRVIQKKVFEASYSEAEREAALLAKIYNAELVSVDSNNFPMGEFKPIS
jgi:hypothetical protein